MDERAASLCNEFGYYLSRVGNYDGARPYLERALTIREQVLGKEHPGTALSLNNLGLLLMNQGDYAAAKPYLERALAIWEQVLGKDHPTTRIVRSNIHSLDECGGILRNLNSCIRSCLTVFVPYG
jgi:Tfp pilus assembly protein PilF